MKELGELLENDEWVAMLPRQIVTVSASAAACPSA
jgi:hypothetical protein